MSQLLVDFNKEVKVSYTPSHLKEPIYRAFKWMDNGKLMWCVCDESGKLTSSWRYVRQSDPNWGSVNRVLGRLASLNAELILETGKVSLKDLWGVK